MDFYLNKPASIFDLFQTTFQIFCRGWKTILSVYFLVNLLDFISSLTLAFISGFGLGLGAAFALVQNAQNQLEVVSNIIVEVCDCFWFSIFEGAICEIVATIYIGGDPCYKRSFKKGWGKKWSLFEFHLVTVPGVFFVIHEIQDKIALHNLLVVALKNVLITAAPGAITFENMSPTKALERSIKLCGKTFCSKNFMLIAVATMLYYNVLVSHKEDSENPDADLSSLKTFFNCVVRSNIFWRV